MKKGRSSNLGLAKDDHELEQSFGIGVGIEHGKSLGQESQQDDPGRPNVDGWRLVLTLEEDFGSSEASCTSSVGSYTRPVRAKMGDQRAVSINVSRLDSSVCYRPLVMLWDADSLDLLRRAHWLVGSFRRGKGVLGGV